jgi:hypothetical protein
VKPPSLADVNTTWCERPIIFTLLLPVHPNKCSLWDWIGYSNNGILASGRCKPFDSAADGCVSNSTVPSFLFLTPIAISFVRAEGAVAIVIKPLEAALAHNDHIYAVVSFGSLPPPLTHHTRGRSWAPLSTTMGLT